jgi:hypothetical protein
MPGRSPDSTVESAIGYSAASAFTSSSVKCGPVSDARLRNAIMPSEWQVEQTSR